MAGTSARILRTVAGPLAGSLVLLIAASLGAGCGKSDGQPGGPDGGPGDGSTVGDGPGAGDGRGADRPIGQGDGPGSGDGPVSGDGGPGGDQGGGGDLGGDGPPPPPPPATCPAPVMPVDTSNADIVVGGAGGPDCTQAGLQTALDQGGIIRLDCGGTPDALFVIALTTQLTADQDGTVVDGQDSVVLSGSGQTRILKVGHDNYNDAKPHVTVQNLVFKDGFTTDVMNTRSTDQGGAAIYRQGASLTVIHSTFQNNNGPQTGQDVAGGAIYSVGGGETAVIDSVFDSNTCSSGGALGFLNVGAMTLVNVTLTNNSATGTDGNPGNGGNGGAIYSDGAAAGACDGSGATGPNDKRPMTLCGVVIQGNQAVVLGGAIFRVVDTVGCLPFQTSPVTMDKTVIDSNTSQGAGGCYLQQTDLTITDSTISRNQAQLGGGLWLSGDQANNVLPTTNLTNVTLARNVARMGGGFWFANAVGAGTLLNVTIAENEARSEGNDFDAFGGASFGSPGSLVLKNSLVANNIKPQMGGNAYHCQEKFQDGGGNVQFPADNGTLTCADGALIADPQLGPLADNGGPAETYSVPAGSPAQGAATDGCPQTDERGDPRSTPCTAGAFEPQ
jgi:hypothetical protein